MYELIQKKGAPVAVGPKAEREGPVQRRAGRELGYEEGAAALAPDNAAQAGAALGTSGASGRLPHLDAVQRSFGAHDVGGIRAHTDDKAGRGARAMGARAFAQGEAVAFDGAPDLHTVAHEAAHVVQQRAGVSLSGGVGRVGDAYEQEADQVADAVVAGRSAEALLPAQGSGTGAAAAGPVQRKFAGDLAKATVDEVMKGLGEKYAGPLPVKWKVQQLLNVSTEFRSVDEVARHFGLAPKAGPSGAGTTQSGPAKAAPEGADEPKAAPTNKPPEATAATEAAIENIVTTLTLAPRMPKATAKEAAKETSKAAEQGPAAESAESVESIHDTVTTLPMPVLRGRTPESSTPAETTAPPQELKTETKAAAKEIAKEPEVDNLVTTLTLAPRGPKAGATDNPKAKPAETAKAATEAIAKQPEVESLVTTLTLAPRGPKPTERAPEGGDKGGARPVAKPETTPAPRGPAPTNAGPSAATTPAPRGPAPTNAGPTNAGPSAATTPAQQGPAPTTAGPGADAEPGLKGAYTHAEVAGSLFGRDGEPRPEHVRQGDLGDCWLIAALDGLARTGPGRATLTGMVRDLGGSYQVTFPGGKKAGKTIPDEVVTVSKAMAIAPYAGRFAYAMKNRSTRDADVALWPGIIEKAAAKSTFAKEALGNKPGVSGYAMLEQGGTSSTALKLLTGKTVGTVTFLGNAQKAKTQITAMLAKGPVVAAQKTGQFHAWSVVEAKADCVVVRDPNADIEAGSGTERGYASGGGSLREIPWERFVQLFADAGNVAL